MVSDQQEYYKEELAKMKSTAINCNKDFLNYVEFFMDDANVHMAGIDPEVHNEVKSYIRRFRENCYCGRIITR